MSHIKYMTLEFLWLLNYIQAVIIVVHTNQVIIYLKEEVYKCFIVLLYRCSQVYIKPNNLLLLGRKPNQYKL